VLGPNINAPMEDSAVAEAYELSRQAHQLRNKAHPRNRGLIEALQPRYGAEPVEDRAPLDVAYAEAMRQVGKRYLNDALVQALLAEALMDLHPWQYWQENGDPQPYTPEILDAIRTALRLYPDHLLANHLHIHAMEMSPHPKLAEANADRLRRLAPDSGHLLHMPAHIYMRIGRYADAAEVNRIAIEHDQAYKQRANPEGIYPLGYMPHNRHFLVVALARSGQSRAALEHAFKLAQEVDAQKMREPGYGTLQHFWTMPLYIMVRFGKWDEILNQPAPDAGLKYPKGVWHYARGRALVAKDRLVEAEQELASLEKLARHPFLEDVTIWDVNSTARLLEIAEKVLAGELACARGDLEAAIEHLTEAVQREDALIYEEPSSWYYPARQSLGWVLMKADRYKEAEQVYRKDLDKHYNNGWSLLGLKQVLEKQGRTQEAQKIEQQFQQAWAQADMLITRSRI
jgi:tetratricopeptide (TPR) repeat protein